MVVVLNILASLFNIWIYNEKGKNPFNLFAAGFSAGIALILLFLP